MNLKTKLDSLKSVIKVKLFSQRIPLILSWHLLNRCNRKCKYCFQWSVSCKELSTEEITSIMNEFAKRGTRVIIFSGGEPLLREDIGEIIDYAYSKDIFTGLTSNGSLVPAKIKEIKKLNMLKLSFDGSKEIHDLIRGEGSYDDLMMAVNIAQSCNLNIKFNTTLSRFNLGDIDFILKKAKELNVKVKFQPLSYVHAGGRNIDYLFPDEQDYQRTIKKLILLKSSNKYIINSISALQYLYDWPRHKKIKCYGGRLSCCVSPEGGLYPCTMIMKKIKVPSCLDIGFEKAYYSLPVSKCEGCWCTSTLEMNSFLKFTPDTLLNIKKLFD